MNAREEINTEEIDELLNPLADELTDEDLSFQSDSLITDEDQSDRHKNKSKSRRDPSRLIGNQPIPTAVYWGAPLLLSVAIGGLYLIFSGSEEPITDPTTIEGMTPSQAHDVETSKKTPLATPAWQIETTILFDRIETLEQQLSQVEQRVAEITPLEHALNELVAEYKDLSTTHIELKSDLQLEMNELEDRIDHQFVILEQNQQSRALEQQIEEEPPLLDIDVIGWVRWGSKVLLSVDENGEQRLMDIGDRVGAWRLTQMSGVERWVQFQHRSGVSQRMSVEV